VESRKCTVWKISVIADLGYADGDCVLGVLNIQPHRHFIEM